MRRSLIALQGFGFERVVVRNHQAAVELVQALAPGARDQRTLRVIVFGLDAVADINAQDGKTIADGNARRDDKKVIGEESVASILLPREKMIDDQCSHHHGLARSCRYFESETRQAFLDCSCLL